VSQADRGPLTGPDLGAEGVRTAELAEGGMLLGHFEGQRVLLVRKGGEVYGIGPKCTHYGGSLARGIFDGECVRCPLHHAGFLPETGEARHAPAIDPVPVFAVERRGDRLFVGGRKEAESTTVPLSMDPSSVVIVGGGAAGFAAAEMLRRENYGGSVTLLSADRFGPYDRPNLSKDYLAGTAKEEWMPLRGPQWYREQRIDLQLETRVVGIDTAAKRVSLDGGREIPYGALLLATGAEPVHLDLPGGSLPHVHTLRSMSDTRAILEGIETVRRAVVVGASFIGLEVAASLRGRQLTVHVVAPEEIPMQRVLGPEVGAVVRSLHEERGVHFHLGETVVAIEEGAVTLRGGDRIDADLVVMGVGVRPNLGLAEGAGLRLERGVLVDELLRTSAEGIWAAGDIARWPDAYSGERIRVEHWVVAERQGQTAARNILGRQERFVAAPFFWSQHYDISIHYVGHADSWDEVVTAGNLADHDALVGYRKGGKTMAVASMRRERQSLEAQAAMERGDAAAVDALFASR
jgi:apoptosis-inducing factor 3